MKYCAIILLSVLGTGMSLSVGAYQWQNKTSSFDSVNIIATNDPFPATSLLTTNKRLGKFPLVHEGVPAEIVVDNNDHPGVIKIAALFRRDLSYVSGHEALLNMGDQASQSRSLIIAGTVGKNKLIDRLVAEGRIDLSVLKNKWEQFILVPVQKPFKGVDHALVIAGSDKRGSIYGMFELSRLMGVSPWYWWADAPVKSRRNIYVKSGYYTTGSPQVQYRGIFINDEDPALSGWAKEKFGGFNHLFYERLFELILRMKGNYLWPAMWGKSLWDDDSLSAPLADEIGVVLATSHHEPLMRAHVEWGRYGKGPWNYEQNPAALQQFWKDGLVRSARQEKVVTLGMRGDGDEAMSEATNIELLEKIIRDQRQIIEEVTAKPAEQTPQVWALYKEVQDYYDKGMRVPDDVTLLLCDDNWGQIRILPRPNASPRKGGYGMYYHFDFVGGPRSYKWLNTVQIERVWEQMQRSYEYGVRKIWLTNVGDLKPMEFPISFFMDFAWNPHNVVASDLPEYYTLWADAQFGGTYAKEIGQMLALYTKYNARRKPELLDPSTYSLYNFDEANTVVKDFQKLLTSARSVRNKLPKHAITAYDQLVLFPIEACANLNEMYVAAAKNRLYRLQNRASTNVYAEKVKELFFRDANITARYHALAGGKWNHMMNQTHMGHIGWSDPAVNKMPEVSYIQTAQHAGIGYTLENGVVPRRGQGVFSKSFAPFDSINNQTYFIEVYNTGEAPLSFELSSNDEWIRLSNRADTTRYEKRIFVSIDWSKVSKAQPDGEIVLSGAGRQFIIKVPVRATTLPRKFSGFVEQNGIVSMEAVNFQSSSQPGQRHWEVVPNLGRTGSSIATRQGLTPMQKNEKGPFVEYKMLLIDSGTFTLETWFSPALNFQKDEGLVYALSVDEGAPYPMNLHQGANAADWTYPKWWNDAVTDNIMKQNISGLHLSAGVHTIRYWMIDPGLVLQKIVVKRNGVDATSYLGPPESKIIR